MKYNKNNSDKQFWIYGNHSSIAALKNNKRIIHKVICYEKYYNTIINIINNRSKPLSKDTISIGNKQMIEKILPKESIHQGIIVLVDALQKETIQEFLQKTKKDKNSCVIILDQITDSRNIGSIIRSAIAFNVKAIIMNKTNTPKENSIINKVAEGGVDSINIVEVSNLTNAINCLKKEFFWIVGLDINASSYLHEIGNLNKTALVLGSEGKGMRQLTKKACDFLTKIPMSSEVVDSLNVSNASAIALYEIYKNNNLK